MLTEQIGKLAAAGVTDFFSGMALGVDTWAAMAVLDLRERNPAVKLHCVLPCEGQEDTWTIPAQVRYKYILSEADSVGEKRGGTAATVRYAQKAGREIIYINPETLLTFKWGPAPETKA